MGFLGDLGIGDLGISGSGLISGLGKFAQFLIIVILIAGVFGFWFYLRTNKQRYNKSIRLFEEINNAFTESGWDVATEMNIPNTSVKVFYLKNSKIYLPRGTLQMGKNIFYYGIRKNREWVNFTIKNLDKEMKEVGLNYDHTDMRYANTQLKKLLERNYKNEKWWKAYKNEIAMVMLILMLTFSFWFLIGKMAEVSSSTNAGMETAGEVMDKANSVLTALDNLGCGVSSRSGLVETAPGG